MKNCTLLFLLVLALTNIAAQQKVIDSLKNELRTAKEDTTKVYLLGELVRNYYLYKPDTAILLAQQAYDLSQKLHYTRGVAYSLNRMAFSYSTLGDYARALVLFDQSLQLSQDINDAENIMRAYNNIGDTYLTQKEYRRALGYFMKAQTIQRQGSS